MKICYRTHHYYLLLSPLRRVFKSYTCTVRCYCDIQCRRYSVFTIYYAGNVISHDNVLYLYISTAQIKCTDLNVAVSCGYFMSCFPAKLFRNFLSDFEIVLVAPIIKLNNTIIDL
jgi:hypothetical protein